MQTTRKSIFVSMKQLKFLIMPLSIVLMIACGQGQSRKESAFNGTTKKALSRHWKLQLPEDVLINSFYSVSLLEPSTVIFPIDSLKIKYYFGPGDYFENMECSFEKRKELVQEMAKEGLCGGDGAAIVRYEPFFNATTKLTGLLTYTTDEGREYISLLVSECVSHQWINLTFESVGKEHRNFIDKILPTLEFVQ